MINIAIVEDDKTDADVLIEYLKRFKTETNSKGGSVDFNITHFCDAENFLKEYLPVYSIVFMDIKLSIMDGVKAAAELRKKDASVVLVFITNMASYACKGYEVGALDFVIKPIKYGDFVLKMNRAVRVAQLRASVDITIPIASGFCRIASSELLYVEVIGHYVRYHLVDRIIEARGTLLDAEKKLAGCCFLRCNYCYLVNPRFVTAVSGFTVQVGNDFLPISQPKRKTFLKELTSWMAGEKSK